MIGDGALQVLAGVAVAPPPPAHLAAAVLGSDVDLAMLLFLVAGAVPAAIGLLRPVLAPTPALQVAATSGSVVAIPAGVLAAVNGATVTVLAAGALLAVLVVPMLFSREILSGVVGAFTTGLVAAQAVAVFTSGQMAASPGVPFLSQVEVAGQPVPVLVVPHQPGRNLVHVGAESAAVGLDRGDLAAAGPRPGAPQSWAAVDLPAGRSSLWVSVGGAVGQVHLDTGEGPGDTLASLRGADGPECARAALGTLVAGVERRLAACPADRLSPDDAAALRSMVGFLADREVRVLALVGDDSPRGAAAVSHVRRAAAREGLQVVEPGTGRYPVVVVSGWAGADAVVQRVGQGALAVDGIYLAPWLLTEPLLNPGAGQLLPLRYAPNGLMPTRYLRDLAGRFPGTTATAAGYTAWLDVRGAGPPGPVRMFATFPLFHDGGHEHVPGTGGGPQPTHHHAASWLRSGGIIPVSAPLVEKGARHPVAGRE